MNASTIRWHVNITSRCQPRHFTDQGKIILDEEDTLLEKEYVNSLWKIIWNKNHLSFDEFFLWSAFADEHKEDDAPIASDSSLGPKESTYVCCRSYSGRVPSYSTVGATVYYQHYTRWLRKSLSVNVLLFVFTQATRSDIYYGASYTPHTPQLEVHVAQVATRGRKEHLRNQAQLFEPCNFYE